jgi:peptide deformylase
LIAAVYAVGVPDAWIRQLGDPTLRQVALPIATLDDLLRHQIARMQRKLHEVAGVGLAGPQIGFIRRVFAFRLDAESPIDALVNPRIAAASDERALFLEGCLSFNAIAVEVERSVAVRVEGNGLDGSTRILEVDGFGASLIQHEIDHLDGILTLDRATPAERRRAMAALRTRDLRAA